MPTKKLGSKKKSGSPAKSTSRIKAAVDRDLTSSSTPEGKVDLEALRKRNAPLAEVVDEFIMTKTKRDDRPPLGKDLMRVIDARDPTSRLGQALAKLERQLSAAKKKAGTKKPKK